MIGRRWRRPPRECPPWCGGGHYCTAQFGYPSGEHRSEPRTWRLAWGVMVLTRVQRLGTPGRLEVRMQVDLSGAEPVAHDQAAAVVVEVDQAVRSALLAAGWLDAAQPEYVALPGGSR